MTARPGRARFFGIVAPTRPPHPFQRLPRMSILPLQSSRPNRSDHRGHRRRRALLAAALLGLATCAVRAEPLPDLVARAKASVLLVGTFGVLDSPRFSFRGSGFVVGDGQQAITSAHVLPPDSATASGERQVAVQVYGGDGQWSLRKASVAAVDQAHDLALLRFEGAPAPTLKLAEGLTQREGSEIAVMGFPIGGVLGYSHVTHRGILAAVTAVALPALNSQHLNSRALAQLRKGNFPVLQLDITAYPGNSGGPVFDVASGEVMGVVSMVLIKGTRESALSSPTGISYAMPIDYARELLEQK